MPNRLADESSPYLLQHQNNPVDWYPWGPQALERARSEEKPIFLSIGYSACHWCHVMEHESFEDESIARQINENFIPIKVDREERPDLDQIYMSAVQIMTGHGGWPMSVFLTPDLEPFYGGTYWPPQARMGMPGFDQILSGVRDAWQNRRQQAVDQAQQLARYIREAGNVAAADEPLDVHLLQAATAALERTFDHTYGGFGGAPKFPHPMDLQLLLRLVRRQRRDGLLEMICLTLDKMAAGGIYDHLGGGFHRYSVDQRWLVPHFEKMLYDNALLARTYVEAWLVTGREAYARVVRETLDYVLREMQHTDGGFFSTQDADSEGVEGKFFVWTPGEICGVLGDEAAERFCRVYDVTDACNFEGRYILNLPKSIETCARLLVMDEAELRKLLGEARAKLFAVRAGRIPPGLDDKVLVSWNGLMIDSLAVAAGALDEPRYLEAAVAAADFLWENLRREDGRLLHTWRNGQARLDGYLDDYAALIGALISVYEASFQPRHIERGVVLAEQMLERFYDSDAGGFFYTASDHERLIARQKDLVDSAVPGGNSLAATALLRLGRLTGRHDFTGAAVATLKTAAGRMREMPSALGQMLLALDFHLGPVYEIVVNGSWQHDDTRAVLRKLRTTFLPNKVLAGSEPQAEVPAPLADLFAGKAATAESPTLYLCENFACQQPAVGRDAALQAISQLPC